MSHHHHAPILNTAILLLLVILTGVGTFTAYWGTGTTNHIGIYQWGTAEGPEVFNNGPAWMKWVVVCQLIAFSLELLFLLLAIPAIIFRKMLPVHAFSTGIAFLILLFLTIALVTFAVNVGSYTALHDNFKLGWSWYVSLSAAIFAFFLFLSTSASTGYGAYHQYR
ncbi:unnamed protein product [Caenorhabditis angaria]|uniref:Uncharacterized protein n=1 Tax=Caenorhabditis angaria TaxID=860376 RepID=A0A9P1N7M7_9PELO|nr:unnamed protein product [Caenorhabditis angaria]